MSILEKKSVRGFALFAAIATAVSAVAAPVDEARKLMDSGRYEEALPLLRKVVKSKPRDAAANWLLGKALVETGNESEGVRHLVVAESRGNVDAAACLARLAFYSYNPEEAQEHLDAWENAARKAKKALPDDFFRMISSVVAMENMLQRVEKIEIIDTLVVDSAAFFRHYRLSPHAGSLAPGEALASQESATVVFVPETRSEMYWAATDSAGHSAVFSSAILDDGTVEHPRQADFGNDGDDSFPFLMPDGMTLYYASTDGPDGLGGYDIYMTRRNDDGTYMQSQNLGMPYNSPFNDYMLAIDETTGLGWWASDRDGIPGAVTIYVYAPAETRVNHDSGAENICALARLSDISLTRDAEKDYKALLASRLAKANADCSASGARTAPGFELDMGARGVYTALEDFRSDDARRAMLRYLAAEAEIRKMLVALERLRESYAAKRSQAVAAQIIEAEERIDSERRALLSLKNTVVRLESGS